MPEKRKNEVPGAPKTLPNEAREAPKSLPGALWGGSWASPGALLGLSGGQSGFRTIWGCLLATPGPLPVRSWISPGPRLAPPEPLLGSLGMLRGWFWELVALLLKALSGNHEKLVFCRQYSTFSWFSMVRGSKKSFQNRPTSLRGASWAQSWPKECAKSGLGSQWETRNEIWKDIWNHLRRPGGD